MTAFGITPASASVQLDDSRRGTASFTVSNETGHPVRVRASVSSSGPAAADPAWLHGPDRPERQLAVDASDQFAVDITVPAGVAGGTYRFRLDAVSVELPDEEWAHGPDVAFVVPEPPMLEDVEPEKIVVEPARGYVPASVGSLLGGLAGALVGLLMAMLLAALDVLPTGSPDPSSSSDLEGALGEAIAGALGAAIGLVVAGLVLMFLGLWLGAVVGAYVALRVRRLRGAGATAVPLAVAFPFWTVAVVVILSFIGDLASSDLVGLVLLLASIPAVTVPPALAARGLHRFRTTGGP